MIAERVGEYLKQPMVEMFSNDPRLGDLAAWDPMGEASSV